MPNNERSVAPLPDAAPELQEFSLVPRAPELPLVPIDSGDPGRQAVRNGAEAEVATCARLLRLGYVQLKSMPAIKAQPFFIPQWRSPYTSMFYTSLLADFYVWHPHKYPDGLLIEHKYQETAGTAEQKLVYTVGCLKKTGLCTILVITGLGFTRGALRWCKEQEETRFIVITSADEWTRRLNRGLF